VLAEAIGSVGHTSAPGSKEVWIISSLVIEEACPLLCEPDGLLELVAERGRRFLLVDGVGKCADSVGDVVRSIGSSNCRRFVAIVCSGCQHRMS
jgi:predicted urease superfamily metal-dependent hydrolase